MFEFFPYIVIFAALAVIIFLFARKFPEMNRPDIAEVVKKKEAEEKAKMAIKKVAAAKESTAEKKEEKKTGETLWNTPESLGMNKAQAAEKQKALATKKQLHQNALAIIDRVVVLVKKAGRFIIIKWRAFVLFVRTKKAELARSRKGQKVVAAEKIFDLLEKAALNFGAGKFKEAERNYIEVIKIDPRNLRAYKGLAGIYESQRNFRDAISSLEEVLKRDPLDKEVSLKLMELRKKERGGRFI